MKSYQTVDGPVYTLISSQEELDVYTDNLHQYELYGAYATEFPCVITHTIDDNPNGKDYCYLDMLYLKDLEGLTALFQAKP